MDEIRVERDGIEAQDRRREILLAVAERMTEEGLDLTEAKGRRRVDGWMRGFIKSNMREIGGYDEGRRGWEGGW
jgi:hypothetical protein